MSRTYTQIRQLTAEQSGMPWFSGTADSSGSSTSILRCAALRKFGDKRWNGYHGLLTSGSPSSTALHVKDFFADNGDARFEPELDDAPNSLTFELLPFDPDHIYKAVVDAINVAYDMGYLVREHWGYMVGGSPIYNADFGYWTSSTAVDGWTATTTTLSRERASGNLALAETSLAMTTAAGNVALDARYARFLTDLKGSTLTLNCFVRTSAASNARISLYNGSENYSSYHGGTGAWELLSVEVPTATTDVDLIPKLYTSTTDTAYFSLPFLTGGSANGRYTVSEYPFPLNTMPDGPGSISASSLWTARDDIASGRGHGVVRQVGRQASLLSARLLKHHDENATGMSGVLDFSASRVPPGDEVLIWLRGDGPLTVPTSALSTELMEVTHSESLLLASMAALNLLEKQGTIGSPSARASFGARINILRANIQEIAGEAGSSRDVAQYGLNW